MRRTIRKWKKQRKVDTKISGPKWFKHIAEESDVVAKSGDDADDSQVEATALDEPSQEPKAMKVAEGFRVGEKRPDKAQEGNVTEKPMVAPSLPKLPVVVGGIAGPGVGHFKTTARDLGGSGGCGWLALAFGLAQANGKTSEDIMESNKLENLAKSLHLRVCNYLTDQWTEWQQQWSPGDVGTHNKLINNVTEAGAPATNLTEFLEVIKRHKRWICGLMLAGFVRSKKVNLVIWTKVLDDNEAVLSYGNSAPTIAVVRQGQHYFGLVRPLRGFPAAWVSNSEVEEIEWTQSDWQLLRGGADNDQSPVKLKAWRDDAWVDEALKTPRT